MKKQNILIIGAHPDDAEGKAGGFAALCRKAGHKVMLMSMTNGSTGHFCEGGGELARRRLKEAQASAALIGAECLVMDINSNQLEINMFLKNRLIEIIRGFQADIVITHRPNDYHPDHRYTSILIQDTSTAIANPNVCALTPRLKKNPVYLYMSDDFQKPLPFNADLIYTIDDIMDIKIDMYHNHESQMYEWLPWENGTLNEIPEGEKEKKAWLRTWRSNRDATIANNFRDKLKEKYGAEKGGQIKFAEAFEFSEYGNPIYRRSANQGELDGKFLGF